MVHAKNNTCQIPFEKFLGYFSVLFFFVHLRTACSPLLAELNDNRNGQHFMRTRISPTERLDSKYGAFALHVCKKVNSVQYSYDIIQIDSGVSVVNRWSANS